MKLINNIESLITDNEYKITIKNNILDILNYIKILSISDTKILIKLSNNNLNIIGSNLSIKKLLSDEVLISGNIISIEFR